jgi:hypothetical protein
MILRSGVGGCRACSLGPTVCPPARRPKVDTPCFYPMDYLPAAVLVLVVLVLAFDRDNPRRRIAGRPLVRTRDLFKD